MSRQEAGKARLLTAARKAASETSASRVSLRDIAKAAGFSPAACYRYFASREQLVDALAEEVAGEMAATIAAAAEGQTSAEDRIAAAAHAYLTYAIDNRGAFDLAFERAEGDWVATTRAEAGMILANRFGDLAGRPDLGPALWGAVHGLADLLLKGVIDIGQRDMGASVLRSRGETLMRGLIERLGL